MNSDTKFNFQVASLTINVITIFITWHIAKRNISLPHKRSVLEKQLDLIFLPAFKLLERHLFKDIDNTTAKSISHSLSDIVENNYEFVPSDLVYFVRRFQEKLENNTSYQETYNQLCEIVGRYFDTTRKQLGLPTRTLSFKLQSKQYSKEHQPYIDMIWDFIWKLLSIIFVILFIYIVVLTLDYVKMLLAKIL